MSLQSFKGRGVKNNQKVSCFWNLHHDVFSLQGGYKEDGKNKTLVLSHGNLIVLKDVEFVVRQAGREKVLQEQRKNVHAFVKGKFQFCFKEFQFLARKESFREAYYNPYYYDSFIDKKTGKKITKAKGAVMYNKKVYYIPA